QLQPLRLGEQWRVRSGGDAIPDRRGPGDAVLNAHLVDAKGFKGWCHRENLLAGRPNRILPPRARRGQVKLASWHHLVVGAATDGEVLDNGNDLRRAEFPGMAFVREEDKATHPIAIIADECRGMASLVQSVAELI